MLCDDCEVEILATEEDNASLKEVKVCLTINCRWFHPKQFQFITMLIMQASLQTGWWREDNWVLPILILASATLLLLLLFQVIIIVVIIIIIIIITFLVLTQTWHAGSTPGQINQGQGQQQVRPPLILPFALILSLAIHACCTYTGN